MRALPSAAARPPEITLTDFVDFAIRTPAGRITKVRELKYRPDYSPLTDYWKPLRDAIREFHRTGGTDRSLLDRVVTETRHAGKAARYRQAVADYKRFLGRKELPWLAPRKGTWSHDELSVSVNPELGLQIKGRPTLVKLYFKREPIPKRRVQAVLQMMAETVGAGAGGVAVLDVANNRLHVGTGPSDDARLILEMEAAAFLLAWRRV